MASKKSKKKSKKAAKSPSKKSAKRLAKKSVKNTAKKKAPRKAKPSPKKKSPVKKAAVKTVAKAKKKPTPAGKKQIVGEGDYAATHAFDKDQESFVKKNAAKIPLLGKAAEKALDGPEGDLLREAEAAGLARSRDTF